MLINQCGNIEMKPVFCECCEQDENGNWFHEPCCNTDGICEAGTKDKNETLDMCIHCGGQMFKENGLWFHHQQEEIPYSERTPHRGI